MPPEAALIEARSFAQSVAGVLDRHVGRDGWTPGGPCDEPPPGLPSALDELGWMTLAQDRELVSCAGLAAVELGRRLASVRHVDRLLGGAPMAGELVRSLAPEGVAVQFEAGAAYLRDVRRAQPAPSAEGIHAQRVLELGAALGEVPESALGAWLAAGVGYLAGLGEGALELTVDYVRGRRAFGATLGALGPVQQLLADALTATRGVRLLAAEGPDEDALLHAGPAVAEACAACQQVTGALGFTLEYPLHRYTQRARALAVWNDALVG